MSLLLKNPAVAKKYETTIDIDVVKRCPVWAGNLSDITPQGAAYLIAVKDAHLQLKKAPEKVEVVVEEVISNTDALAIDAPPLNGKKKGKK